MVVRRDERIGVLVPIRAFVHEQLDQTERAARETAHARWFAQLAKTAAPELIASHQQEWLDRLDADTQDLHFAVRRMPAASAVETASALVRWWVRRSHWSAGREVLGEVLARADQDIDPNELARALAGAAELATLQGHLPEAMGFLDRADALGATGSAAALVQNIRGLRADVSGDLEAAEEAFQRAGDLAAEAGDLRLATIAATNMGGIAHRRANDQLIAVQAVDEEAARWFERARVAWIKGRDLARAVGDEHLALQLTLNLASIDMSLGYLEQAQTVFLEVRHLAEQLGELSFQALANHNLGVIHRNGDEAEVSAQYFDQALTMAEELGDAHLQGSVLYAWSILLDDSAGGDWIAANLSRIRRSLALAKQLGDAEAIEQRTFVLTRLLETQAESSGTS